MAIPQALGVLGRRMGADRAWIVRYNSELTHFWNTHEWTRGGTTPFVQDLQGASVSMMPTLHRKLLRGELDPIPDVARLPRQQRSLQAELRRQGIRSTLNIPLIHARKLRGFYGFDYVRGLRSWTAEELRFARAAAKFLAALVHRAPWRDPAMKVETARARRATIYLRTGQVARAIEPDEIVLIEAEGDYTRLHLADGQHHLELHSLRDWATRLPAERFLRVHRRYLVNFARIERLEKNPRKGWSLFLTGQPAPTPIGRAYRHEIRQRVGC